MVTDYQWRLGHNNEEGKIVVSLFCYYKTDSSCSCYFISSLFPYSCHAILFPLQRSRLFLKLTDRLVFPVLVQYCGLWSFATRLSTTIPVIQVLSTTIPVIQVYLSLTSPHDVCKLLVSSGVPYLLFVFPCVCKVLKWTYNNVPYVVAVLISMWVASDVWYQCGSLPMYHCWNLICGCHDLSLFSSCAIIVGMYVSTVVSVYVLLSTFNAIIISIEETKLLCGVSGWGEFRSLVDVLDGYNTISR